MERETYCEYCKQKKAATSCEVCGSSVCSQHKKEHGCAVCGGGVKTFE